MSLTPPSASNNYQVTDDHSQSSELWNSVMTSLSQRLADVEAAAADFEDAVSNAAIATAQAILDNTVGPQLDNVQTVLAALEASIALAEDRLAALQAGGVFAENVPVAESGRFGPNTNAQEAFEQLDAALQEVEDVVPSLEVASEGLKAPGNVMLSARSLAAPEYLRADGAVYLDADYPQLAPLMPTAAGMSWVSMDVGFGTTITQKIGVFQGATVIVGYEGKISRSTNNGSSWALVGSGAASDKNFLGLATDEVNTGVAVGTGGVASRTTNGGASWGGVNVGVGTTTLNAVGTNKNGTWVAGGPNGTIRRSVDGGVNWGAVTHTFSGVQSVYSVAADGAGVWLAGGSAGNLQRSADNGQNWSSVAFGSGMDIRSIASLGDGAWLIGTNTGEIYRSRDGGLTFSPVTSGFTVNSSLFALEYRDGICMAANVAGMMRRSADGGSTWQLVSHTFGSTTIYAIKGVSRTLWLACGASGAAAKSLLPTPSFETLKADYLRPLKTFFFTGEAPE